MRIGLDVLGGDDKITTPVRGAVDALDKIDADKRIVLIGDQNSIEKELKNLSVSPDRFDIVHTSEYISSQENPAKAIIAKPNSSINIGFSMLKAGELDAFISAGSTGAMMVGSVLKLGLIEGVSRPTVGYLHPLDLFSFNMNDPKYCFIADVGANLDSKPEHILNYAQLSSVFMQYMMKVDKPRVALLNIGEEKNKGLLVVQQAYELMEQSDRINFVGNGEGHDLNSGFADIYVCDGFVGNILLKYSESFQKYFEAVIPNPDIGQAFSFERVGGLPFLGVNGNIIIGHGKSPRLAYTNMVLRACDTVTFDLIDHIRQIMRK